MNGTEIHSSLPDRRKAGFTWPAWMLVALPTLVLYAATANRGIQWQDAGMHILRIMTREPVNPQGLALSHPLHHWLGRLAASLGGVEPCLAITLLSSLAGAIAVANVFACVALLTSDRIAALLAAGSLAVAHTFWQLSTITETYTLTAALLSAEMLCVIAYARRPDRSFLWLALIFNGLGLANHNLALLTTPILGLITLVEVFRKRLTLSDVGIGAVLWLLGTIPYLALVASELSQSRDLPATIRSALFGHGFREEVLNVTLSAQTLKVSGGFMALSFPNLLLPAAVFGFAFLLRSNRPAPVRAFIIAGLLIHSLFVLRYPVVDQHFFFLPTYVFLAVLGGLGFAQWAQARRPSRRIVYATIAAFWIATPMVYAVIPDLARRFDVLAAHLRHKPYRDDYTYLLTPWSVVERSAEQMSRQAVELAGANGLIVAPDSMARPALQYQATRRNGSGIRVVGEVTPELIQTAIASGSAIVFVPRRVTESPPEIPHAYWQRDGALYILEFTKGAGS